MPAAAERANAPASRLPGPPVRSAPGVEDRPRRSPAPAAGHTFCVPARGGLIARGLRPVVCTLFASATKDREPLPENGLQRRLPNRRGKASSAAWKSNATSAQRCLGPRCPGRAKQADQRRLSEHRHPRAHLRQEPGVTDEVQAVARPLFATDQNGGSGQAHALPTSDTAGPHGSAGSGQPPDASDPQSPRQAHPSKAAPGFGWYAPRGPAEGERGGEVLQGLSGQVAAQAADAAVAKGLDIVGLQRDGPVPATLASASPGRLISASATTRLWCAMACPGLSAIAASWLTRASSGRLRAPSATPRLWRRRRQAAARAQLMAHQRLFGSPQGRENHAAAVVRLGESAARRLPRHSWRPLPRADLASTAAIVRCEWVWQARIG